MSGNYQLTITARPCITDRFPPNPTYLCINGIQLQGAELTSYASSVVQWLYKGQMSNVRKACDFLYIFDNIYYSQTYNFATREECIDVRNDNTHDLVILYPQLDHENNRRLQMQLCD